MSNIRDIDGKVEAIGFHMLCARHSEEDVTWHVADGHMLAAFKSLEDSRVERVKAFAWFVRWIAGAS